MTVEEFERSLQGFGESLNNLQPILLNIGGRIVDDVKAGAPIDKGALRDSIKAVIEDDSLSISMLYYGIFQNYGVDGMNQAVANDVPTFGVTPQPTTGRDLASQANTRPLEVTYRSLLENQYINWVLNHRASLT